MNLIEGLQKEAERRREMIKEYEALPNGAGMFRATMLRRDIEKIDETIASGDTIKMIGTLKQMQD